MGGGCSTEYTDYFQAVPYAEQNSVIGRAFRIALSVALDWTVKILTEYITKEQAWEVVKIVARHCGIDSIVNADRRLADMPAADVEPVVRCKDCAYRVSDLDTVRCGLFERDMARHDYCNHGRKRRGEE